jgi:hypothetical protein
LKISALKAIGKQERQRKAFPTAEIPHLWFHRKQSDARSQGNVFFDGGTIYSYGTHFPIARHVTSKSGRRAVLFTTRRYSVTTSGHCSSVRQPIPSGTTVFSVPDLGGSLTRIIDPSANLAHFVTESKESLGKARRARVSGQYDLASAFGYRETARKYARFFGSLLREV